MASEDYNATYQLVARYNGQRRSTTVYGNPHAIPDALVADGATLQDRADSDATMSAIPVVMNRACKSEVWANGHIVLRQGSRIIHEMPEKGAAPIATT